MPVALYVCEGRVCVRLGTRGLAPGVSAPLSHDPTLTMQCVQQVSVHMAMQNTAIVVHGAGAPLVIAVYLMFVGCSIAHLRRNFAAMGLPVPSGIQAWQHTVFARCCAMPAPLHIVPHLVASYLEPVDVTDAKLMVMALVSHVAANVPVFNCAIVKAVHQVEGRFASSKVPLKGWELLILAFIKVPCAMHFCSHQLLDHQHVERSLVDWQTAVAITRTHFGVEGARPRDGKYYTDNKKFPYRLTFLWQTQMVRARHNECMLQKVGEVLADADARVFSDAMALVVDWKSSRVDDLVSKYAAVIPLPGGDYRQQHAARTVQSALSQGVLAQAADPRVPTGGHMSASNKAKFLSAVPPFYLTTHEHTAHFLMRCWEEVAASLHIDKTEGEAMIAALGQWDMECFFCETGGKKLPSLRNARGAMEALLQGRFGEYDSSNWRVDALKGLPSEKEGGVFVGTVFASKRLVEMYRAASV